MKTVQGSGQLSERVHKRIPSIHMDGWTIGLIEWYLVREVLDLHHVIQPSRKTSVV